MRNRDPFCSIINDQQPSREAQQQQDKNTSNPKPQRQRSPSFFLTRDLPFRSQELEWNHPTIGFLQTNKEKPLLTAQTNPNCCPFWADKEGTNEMKPSMGGAGWWNGRAAGRLVVVFVVVVVEVAISLNDVGVGAFAPLSIRRRTVAESFWLPSSSSSRLNAIPPSNQSGPDSSNNNNPSENNSGTTPPPLVHPQPPTTITRHDLARRQVANPLLLGRQRQHERSSSSPPVAQAAAHRRTTTTTTTPANIPTIRRGGPRLQSSSSSSSSPSRPAVTSTPKSTPKQPQPQMTFRPRPTTTTMQALTATERQTATALSSTAAQRGQHHHQQQRHQQPSPSKPFATTTRSTTTRTLSSSSQPRVMTARSNQPQPQRRQVQVVANRVRPEPPSTPPAPPVFHTTSKDGSNQTTTTTTTSSSSSNRRSIQVQPTSESSSVRSTTTTTTLSEPEPTTPQVPPVVTTTFRKTTTFQQQQQQHQMSRRQRQVSIHNDSPRMTAMAKQRKTVSASSPILQGAGPTASPPPRRQVGTTVTSRNANFRGQGDGPRRQQRPQRSYYRPPPSDRSTTSTQQGSPETSKTITTSMWIPPSASTPKEPEPPQPAVPGSEPPPATVAQTTTESTTAPQQNDTAPHANAEGSSLYDRRNQHLVQAIEAGHDTRWGVLETNKATAATRTNETNAIGGGQGWTLPTTTTTTSTASTTSTAMDELARAWGAMNQDHDDTTASSSFQSEPPRVPLEAADTAAKSEPPPPTFRTEPPVLAMEAASSQPPPATSSMTMEDLARAWGTMNQDHEDTSSSATMPPVAAALKQEAPPASSSSPSFESLPRSEADLYQQRNQHLVAAVEAGHETRWGVLETDKAAAEHQVQHQVIGKSSHDNDKDNNKEGTTTASFATEAPSSSTTSTTTTMEDLARAWGAMNQDHDDTSSSSSSTMPPVAASPPASSSFESLPRSEADLYQQRNQHLVAAVEAGHETRWGVLETDKAAAELRIPHDVIGKSIQDDKKAGTTASFATEAPSSSTTSTTTMEDLARAWGAMNQDHDDTSSSSSSSTMPPVAASPPASSSFESLPRSEADLYQQRNQHLVAAVEAGHETRWGVLETDKAAAELRIPHDVIGKSIQDDKKAGTTASFATEAPSSSTASTTTMEDLARAWGAMNQDHDDTSSSSSSSTMPPVAAAISSPKQEAPPSSSSFEPSLSEADLYQQRNQHLVAAVEAGHETRWGVLETDKAAAELRIQQDVIGKSMTDQGTTPPPMDDTPLKPPATPASSVTIEDLAREWGAMNQDHDTSSDTPTMTTPTSSPPFQKEAKVSPSEPPAAPVSSVTMDDLAREWGAMNSDHDTTSQVAFPTATWTPETKPVPEESPVVTPPSSGTMDDLAREWGAMNRDHDTSTTTTRTTEFTVVEELEEKLPPPSSSMTMDDLAREWGAMNCDHDSSASSADLTAPAASWTPEITMVEVIEEKHATTTPPMTMDDLAQAWGAMNSDHDSINVNPAPSPPPSSSSWTPPSPEAPHVPDEPAASTVTMDDLAREWGAMNTDHDSSSSSYSADMVAPSSPAWTYKTVAETPVVVPEETPVVASPSVTMDDLAREWSSINADHEAPSTDTPANSVTPFGVVGQHPSGDSSSFADTFHSAQEQPPVASSPSPTPSAVSMDDLAREWSTRNHNAEDDPMKPGYISTPPPPPPSQDTQGPATTEPQVSEPTVVSMDDLAREWSTRNHNAEDDPMKPGYMSPPPPPPSSQNIEGPTTTEPQTSEPTVVSMDDLAREWSTRKHNAEDDPMKPGYMSPPPPPPSSQNIEGPATTEPQTSEPSAVSMNDLARAWSARNHNADDDPRKPGYVTPSSSPETTDESSSLDPASSASTPSPVSSFMDILAQEWSKRNKDPETE